MDKPLLFKPTFTTDWAAIYRGASILRTCTDEEHRQFRLNAERQAAKDNVTPLFIPPSVQK